MSFETCKLREKVRQLISNVSLRASTWNRTEFIKEASKLVSHEDKRQAADQSHLLSASTPDNIQPAVAPL